MSKKNFALVFAFLLVLGGPLLLREKQDAANQRADETLVVVTPHNEAIRYEFGRAFSDYFFAKTKRRVRIDWRTPGGTSEIARYINSEYLASFQNYWTNALHKSWSAEIESAFDNAKAPQNNAARHAFLQSNVSCGIDIFFGGGSYDFIQQANAGRLVDCGFIAAHPEIFNANAIPQNLSGEPLWDAQGRWVGACLGAFGICSNVDALARLGFKTAPDQWADLADPKYFGQIALADPTQSGSVAKAFEMLIQQQMQQSGATFSAPNPRDGWTRAMQLIQRISANARYFTDSAAKIPFDVENGDSAAGMCVDFYGRFQSEFVRKADGFSRMNYVTPVGGSSVGADPIGLFRGAPHADLAREFIEFVLSMDGQKLWDFKTGAPGGPMKYELRRLPILPQLYAPEFAQFRADADVEPYQQAKTFVYHPEWTAQLFSVISFVVRAMCIDPHSELAEAWRALIAANFPPQASAVFCDVSAVNYDAANHAILQALRASQKIEQVRLAQKLSDHFREQYRRAADLARAGK